ncbi:hypothetical protein, partial [Klebsiella pneumoniae]|uniref:hypothetical protein n=1 Tax=Klebsiella pneumoniae TaxID=573 RepID=UPI0027304CC6
MNNHNTLFKNVMKFVGRTGLRFHDLRLLTVFIWAVIGAIQSQSPHLSTWIAYHGGQAVAASKARQFSRWIHNERIDPMKAYLSLV